MRSWTLWALPLILLGPAARAEVETGTTPFYLPRAVFVGTLLNDGAVTPQVRIQWEGGLLEQSQDVLGVMLEVGGGYAVGFPRDAGATEDVAMTYLYQHQVVVGLAYRGWRYEHFRWGLHVALGPHFYGARFDGLPTENRVNGVVEGRLRLGWDLGAVSVGVSGGYASRFWLPSLSNTAPYVGGFVLGAYVDWWH